MNLKRIKTILLHSWYHFNHSMETWVDLFFNSSLQMVVFAFIALYFSGNGNSTQAHFMLMGMILWNVIWIGQYSIAVGALWEIWSRSFSGLFMTPLTLEEFLIAQMVSSVVKAIAVFLVTAGIGFYIYHFSIFSLGPMLLVYFAELLLFAWAAGIFVLSLIFAFGTQVQSLSWALIFLVQPFGGVFYPTSILPPVLQIVAGIFPTTYVFEAARQQLEFGRIAPDKIAVATILNIFAFILAYWFMKNRLARAKETGAFARMEN